MSFIEDNELWNITFSELKHLNCSDLTHCVSKDNALLICKSLESCESKPSEVLHLWVNKLINAFEGSKFNATEWKLLIDLFKQITQQVATVDNELQLISVEEGLICDVLELLKWFQQFIADFGAAVHCMVLGFASETILRIYQNYSKSKPDNGFYKCMQEASALHVLLLQVVNESVVVLNISDAEEFGKLTELLNTLCSLGEQTPSVALKVIIETWKCITNLTVYCLQFSNLGQTADGITESFAAWTLKPLRVLIEEIKGKLALIYNEKTLQQPTEQVEKYLRVINFYITLLQRLASDLKHEKFPCALEFLKTFLLAKSTPKYIQNSQIIKFIEKYVHLGLCDIFRVIYRNKCIKEFLVNAEVQNNKEVVILMKELTQAILSDKDIEFANESAEDFIKTLQHWMKDASMFCDITLYSEVVELFAGLAIINTTGRLKAFLRSAVLKEHCLLVQISVDILLTIARSSHTRTEDNLQNFHYWRVCNEKFAVFTDNPREHYVKRLLLHYFKLCEASGCITKSELWKESDEAHPCKSNYRLTIALGLSNASAELFQKVSSNVSNLVNQVQTRCTPDNYYEMLMGIKLLLSRKEIGINTELMQQIFHLGLHFLKVTPKNDLQQHSPYLAVVLEIILDNFNTLEESVVFSILEGFQEQQLYLPDCILFLLCLIMNVVSKKYGSGHKLQQMSESFLAKLHSKPSAELFKWLHKLSTIENLENCKLDSSLYEQLNAEDFLKHNCEKPIMSPENQQQMKRMRLENSDATNSQLMLEQMHELSRQLVVSELSLDPHDVNVINSIVNNLEQCKSQNQQRKHV